MQARLATGDFTGAADQASYHLPFLGNARSSLTAWQQGDRSEAAFYAALFGLETLGPKRARRRPAGARVVEGAEQSTTLLNKAIPNSNAFLASAKEVWKQGAQGSLSNAGRALQKHADRAGSAFSDIKFSGKTANQEAMKIIEQIMNSSNQVIEKAPQGGYWIYDKLTGRGVAVSRDGLFSGFRNFPK